MDLATIRRVLERELTIAEVAAVHVEALGVQIRTLRLRQAVLRAVAKRGSDQKEIELMHRLAQLSDEDRRTLIREFLDEVLDGLEVDPEFATGLRSMMPELPDDPAPEQVEAWVELAELVGDGEFRASIRRMAERQAADRASGAAGGDVAAWKRAQHAVLEQAGAAIAAGMDPASDQARPTLNSLTGVLADAFGRTDDAEFRDWLIGRIETGMEPRAEQYMRLLATVNGWPPGPDVAPAGQWLLAALRAQPAPASPRV